MEFICERQDAAVVYLVVGVVFGLTWLALDLGLFRSGTWPGGAVTLVACVLSLLAVLLLCSEAESALQRQS